MSLQGSIETFAIADVLRLLAATSKSGRLHVQGPSRAGTVWVDNARLLAAESPSTPLVSGPVDVLFQLLRFERGSFRFELDKYPPEPGEPLDIELALGEAESMLAEWRDLEARIPSAESWVELKALSAPSVTFAADEWSTVVAAAGGRSVGDIGHALHLGELQTARALARLLDLEVIDIGDRPVSPASGVTGNGNLLEAPVLARVSTDPAPGLAPPSPERAADPELATSPDVAAADVPAADHPVPVSEEAAPSEPPTLPPAPSWSQANGSAGSAAAPLAEQDGPSGLAPPPPGPATPLTPPPSWAPATPSAGWAVPDYASFVPPPEPAPAPEQPFSGQARPEAGLRAPQDRGSFTTPPETELDGGAGGGGSSPTTESPSTESPTTESAANTFTYPAADAYSYPPPSGPAAGGGDVSAPPASPPTMAAGSWATPPQSGTSGGGNGYPAVAPPMPPSFSPPAGASSLPWNPSGQVPTQAATPAAGVGQPDAGWIGSLTDAIGQADDAASAETAEQPAVTIEQRANREAAGPGPGEQGLPPMPLAPRVNLGGASWGNSPVPPPPAPPAPSGGWASSATLFEGGGPERLAPPPPPPPPMVGLPGLAAGSAAPDMADRAGSSAEDADDIDSQLFNLSPRAREAVKQSSGLYDGRDRR